MITKSLVSDNPVTPLFSLGALHISDFLKPSEQPRGGKYHLSLSMDIGSSLIQLDGQPPAELMWGETYWYKSGTNQFMLRALEDVVTKTKEFLPKTAAKRVWLDIASNDGSLLSFLDSKEFYRVGIDPSSYLEAEGRADKIVKDYFSSAVYNEKVREKADVVTCCAMFYDLSDPISFVKQVNEVMSDDGVFVLQLSYTPLMVIQGELGNVCHEHIAYYNLKSLDYVLSRAGFKIEDLELNNVNGGSIRVYCTKTTSKRKVKTQADRDVAEIRIKSLFDYEKAQGFHEPTVYREFYRKMLKEMNSFLEFLRVEKANGKTFWGYGASTKGNTILQWYGLGPQDIDKIAERQERKFGLVCSGSNIPVCSEEEARRERPDYMIVFPWHFISEFVEREEEYLRKGGKFIVLSPKFEIIGYEPK